MDKLLLKMFTDTILTCSTGTRSTRIVQTSWLHLLLLALKNTNFSLASDIMIKSIADVSATVGVSNAQPGVTAKMERPDVHPFRKDLR